eukprot:3632700-Prymnesium_polylepis.1
MEGFERQVEVVASAPGGRRAKPGLVAVLPGARLTLGLNTLSPHAVAAARPPMQRQAGAAVVLISFLR